MACRQELVDAGEDVYVSPNVRQRRNSCRKGGLDDIEHLISSVSIRKNLAQILTRKQVIRAVLDGQTRQRRCNQFDYTLVAMKSIEHSRTSIYWRRRAPTTWRAKKLSAIGNILQFSRTQPSLFTQEVLYYIQTTMELHFFGATACWHEEPG
eukprot:scaffold19110_cov89-Skeletonema_marinoi.AAC.2